MIQGNFKSVSKKSKGASRKIVGYFFRALMSFHGSFKGVSWVFLEWFKDVFRAF